jgi:ABC-type uncharacterized transport system substrate-binding protein
LASCDTPGPHQKQFEGFRDGLRANGYVEGQSIVIEQRYADGAFDRLGELAAELVRLNLDVIVVDGAQHMVTGFRRGLKEAGYIEGQNVVIEYRSAEGRLDRLSALASDLLRHPVEMIVGNSVSAKAAKAATTTVPIIFVYGGDPIKDGLVTSINRPGGNVTGVIFLGPPIGGKRFELLHDLVPHADVIALLTDP